MQPELTQAFIHALTGNAENPVDWRAIHDRDKGEQGVNLRGTFTEVWQQLQDYNSKGWGIFTCINAFNGQGQTLNCISHIRTHVVDLDDALSSHASYEQASNSVLPPHVAVQSSPNKFHLYWFVEPYTGNDFYTTHQRKFAQLYNGDKVIIDPTRVMRVPGFNHCKGEPTPVSCWSVSNNAPYTSAQIQEHLSNVNVIEHVSSRSPLGTSEMQAPSLEWATLALNLRDPNTLTRGEWLTSSAAFRQCTYNAADQETVLEIWQKWCARYTEHQGNDVGENMKMWKTFEKGTEVGWSHFKRVTVIDAHILNSGKSAVPPAQELKPQSVLTPVTLKEDEEEEFGEILDTYSKRRWFKNCFFVASEGQIFTPSGRFMNSNKFNGKYGGKQFCMSTAGSKVINEPWQAALRATDWRIPNVDHVRFLPEKNFCDIVKDSMGRKGLNTYIPAQIEMEHGDATIWTDHLNKMFACVEDQNIFCSYLAHCVKYPGYKIPWAPLLQSMEGAGKTIFAQVMQHAVGEMYTYSPKAPELVSSGSKFNAWMRSKLIIIVDEIRIDERRELIEILKPMITDVRVEVQAKGSDQEMEDNCANWVFFTNHKDAIPVGKNGRRYCVFFSPLQTRKDLLNADMGDQYYKKQRDWLDVKGDKKGLKIITQWLMDYPVEKGSLPGRAPDSSSYEEALRISRSPLEVLLDEKTDNKEYGFKNGYVSLTMFTKAVANSKMRTPPEHVLRSILESRDYCELGTYTRILSNEDFGKPPLLFGKDSRMSIENYEAAQAG